MADRDEQTAGESAEEAELAKAYRPGEVEGAIFGRWLDADVFNPDGVGSRADWSKPPFVIIQPPPNVTGSLHLGHAQRSTVEDLMTRHARMQGRPSLFLPGLDHASIAAQYVLDKLLAAKGETRQTLGREKYLEAMWEFVLETRQTILSQQRRVGASLDMSRLRFTMDEVSARAVREAFLRLYREGLAYRTEALIHWCPGCRTSVSDLEVIPKETTGSLWTIRYHLVNEKSGAPDPNAWIAVATTRPETLLGDTAVAVNPEDPRYEALVGRRAVIPFVNRVVPIIADPVVDRAFGTGAVKITPAHDRDDYDTGKRHGLPMITVLDDAARVNENGAGFAGLDRYEARLQIVDALQAAGDLESVTPHEMMVGHCQRSDDVVEPRLKTQWFVRVAPLAAAALEATRSGTTQILPDRFVKVWEHWMTEMRDWNVSRQLWWGHRIPAWYCPDGHITVVADPAGPSACEVCGRPAADLRQDEDIFDTWFSSGLWPFSTLGWPEQTRDLQRFYPGSVMETAYDIIFFWVARMMMLGIHLTGEAPFHTVYLSGLIRDPYGQKMSKTKGNTVDPLQTIDVVGADALRFALVNGTAPGNDARLGTEKLENARNFANKLWNVARFVLGARPASIAAGVPRRLPDRSRLGPADRWILSRAAATVEAVDRAMAEYAFGDASQILYEAIWNEYCDWGVELAKIRLADTGLAPEEREATWWTLVDVLDTYLRLLHPIMPFITETIWERLPHSADDPALLIVADWPAVRADSVDASAEAEVAALIDLVRAVRNARAEARVEPAAWLPVDVLVPEWLVSTFRALQPAIERLSRARPLVRASGLDPIRHGVAGGLAVIAGEIEAVVRPAARDDAQAERDRARLERELAEAQGLLASARARLANEAFTSKAPPPVVEAARARATELEELVARLAGRLG
ncbi:MAG: valine--tRNA ligase [Candidatus Limnocylindrales bacterium]|jgi:valyl-tRNA synthetase